MADSQLGLAVEFAVPLLIRLSQNWLSGLLIAGEGAVTLAPRTFSLAQLVFPTN
jgi:hypothetical protein